MFIKKQNGFTLVEVMVSLAILVITVLGAMAISTTGIWSNRAALDESRAMGLAQEKMEELLLLSSDSLEALALDTGDTVTTDTSEAEYDFTDPFWRTWTVDDSFPTPSAVTINVMVTWSGRGSGSKKFPLTSVKVKE